MNVLNRSPIDQPRRPLSEVEWEELLVRLELMPRALGVTMENFAPESKIADRVLRELADREAEAGEFLEAAVTRGPAADVSPRGTPVDAASKSARAAGQSVGHTGAADMQPVGPQSDALDRFMRFRRRNFAIVQRRGIEIWEWEAPLGQNDRVTIYQMIAYLVEADVAALMELREAATGPGAC